MLIRSTLVEATYRGLNMMTVPFEMHGKIATLEVDIEGYKVTVTVHPKPGTTITTEDAAVILANAAGHFPSCVRFPEPLNRR